MHGFIVEILYPSGWSREGKIYWRRSDAEDYARPLIKRKRDSINGYRILPIQISGEAVAESIKGETPEAVCG